MKKLVAIASSILVISGISMQAQAATETTTTTPVPAPKANLSIAVVNVQQIFQQSPKIADLNKKLQTEFKDRQAKLIADQKNLQDEVDRYKKESPTMSQKDKDALQKKITDDQAELNKEATAFQQDLSKEQNRMMKSVVTELNGIISGLAKQNSYSLVLDSQAVIYAADSTDITKQVSSAFNK